MPPNLYCRIWKMTVGSSSLAWINGIQRFSQWVNLEGKEKNNKCITQKHKFTGFQIVACESKEMDERHTNSTFSQVHWGRGFSFIKTHHYHQTKIGKALGGSGRISRQQWTPEIKEQLLGHKDLCCHNEWIINWISQTQTPWTNSSNNYRPNDHRLRSLLNDFLK